MSRRLCQRFWKTPPFLTDHTLSAFLTWCVTLENLAQQSKNEINKYQFLKTEIQNQPEKNPLYSLIMSPN